MIVPPEGQSVAPRPVPPLALPGARAASVPEPPRRIPRWLRVGGLGLAAASVVGVGAAIGLARFGGAYERDPFEPRVVLADGALTPEELAARATKIEKRLAALAPRKETYVVVDTYANRLQDLQERRAGARRHVLDRLRRAPA